MPRITFFNSDGTNKAVEADVGDTILDVARKSDVNIEGACDGSMACSTCHIIVDKKWYSKLDEMTEDEEDMLDLAFGLTRTSRLGCQIRITETLDGLVVSLPKETRNMLTG
tara:strand:+ start:259 stop:591 length:333 start_codon:yes stop_codon:yes gene_type:complete